MPPSTEEIWNLLAASGLVGPAEIEQLQVALARDAAAAGSGDWLAQRLVATGVITPYQARLLSAGRSGPFFYGDYKVTDRLEKGRLAGLFRATNLISGRAALLFFLSGPALQDPRRWSWVVEQCRAATALDHPYVAHVYELVDLVAFKFVACESLLGASLNDARPPVRDLARSATIVYETLSGLAALHEQGYAHGDVRPANVWITQEGPAKLIQFPLARDPFASPALELGKQETAARMLSAADYAAPELAQPGRLPDAASDMYAAGCMFYELLSGRAPFEGGTPREKLTHHATRAVAPLSEAAGVPAELSSAVERMMAKQPQRRFATVEEAMEAIAAHVPAARRATVDEIRSVPSPVGGGGAESHFDFSAESPEDYSAAPTYHPHGHGAEPASATDQPLDWALGGQSPFAAARAAQRARGSRNNVLAGLALLVFLGGLGFFLLNSETGKQILALLSPPVAPAKKNAELPSSPKPANEKTPADVPRPEPDNAIVPDDGKTMWASPTAGPPLDLRYLPSGSPCLLAVRPADIVRHPEGGKLLDALGPAAGFIQSEIKQIIGMQLGDIQELQVAFYPREAELPEVVLTARLRPKVLRTELHKLWGKPTLPSDEKPYFEGERWAYYFPSATDDRLLVVAEPETMAKIAKGGPPARSPAMERVAEKTDSLRHFTILVAPKFLLGDGSSMLVGNLAKLAEPLSAFLGDTTQAAALSVHLDENLFLELRAYGAAEKKPPVLVADYRQRLAHLPAESEAYLGTLALQPYGRSVLLRLPRMLSTIGQFTRAEVEDRQAVLRCYLPAKAAHNLVLGTDLALIESPGTRALAPSVAQQSASSKTEDLLKRTISLSFPKDTLERCMELLSQEIGVEIVILGSDLQLEGITRNQSFELNERDKPASEILRAVLAKANPEGKLVYVIKPKAAGEKEAIFITTRAAAAKRGDKLPPGIPTS